MAPFLGVRGSKLHLAIWMEACFGVMIFGYNQSAAGEVLSDSEFNLQFPRMVTGALSSHYTPCLEFSEPWDAHYLEMSWAVGKQYLLPVWCRLPGPLSNVHPSLLPNSSLGSGVSKAESRGEHVPAFRIFCGSGIALALWVAFGMSYTQPSSVSWRFPLAFTIFLSFLVCISIFSLPGSPRWLCKMDRWEEGREILALLYDEDQNSETVNKEIEDIRISIERVSKGKLGALFKMGHQRTFHHVVIAAVAQIFLQMTGVNSITYYAPTIYQQQLHFASSESGLLAASSQLVLIIGAVCCAWTVDRFGRRKLMMFSASSMAICFAFIAGLISQENNPAALKGAVFFLYLYFFVYVLGFLGIPEIAPTHLRAATCGLSPAISWLFNFLVAEVTPVAFDDIGWKYFIVYCCLNASFVPVIYFFFPETAKRSLEEIGEIFEASQNIFDTVSVAQNLPKRHLSEFVRDEKGPKAAHFEA
ncbi:uncharacterized protein N7483_011214 [Penicillium malachiteum]|uniref:uncharacterized protein n=1 Tax=Penicillium malachiteum TaxID=1324776 RepID=UPI002549505A|nr:uncharacterized protein N7483_011214 [Penicillium malachiteum]KAJ5714033.1 hypothetical protein N7483_011214 [Penicillium malachiteum]